MVVPDDAVVHVIDDDAVVLGIIALQLQPMARNVIAHGSPATFLAALKADGDANIFCVLTDVQMPVLDGISLVRHLRARNFAHPIIVMTAHSDVPTAVQAMKAGADDYIEKPFDEDELRTKLEAVVARDSGGRHLAAARAAASRIGRLPPREREVLSLMVAGETTKVIARSLELSPRTVEAYRASLMTRLGVQSLAEAVRLAVLAEEGSPAMRSPVRPASSRVP